MTDVSAGTEREGESDHAPEGRGSAPRSNLLSKATEGRIVRGTRCKRTHLDICWCAPSRISPWLHHTAQDIAVHERKNWLIHLHYIRKDFETCKVSLKHIIMYTFACIAANV